MEDCKHDLIDRYVDGAAECAACGKELGPAGLMLKHLGLEPKEVEDKETEQWRQAKLAQT